MMNKLFARGALHTLCVTACAVTVATASPLLAWAQPTDSDAVNLFVDISTQFTLRVEELEREIADAESTGGPYAEQLREPLTELTHLYVDSGNYDEAEQLLNRRLQILRVNEGPGTLSQLPAIMELMTNDLRQGNMSGINDQFKFLTWLHTRNPNAPTVERLDALANLATWHQAAVYVDSPEKRVLHFMDYRRTTETMLQMAEEEFGLDSIEAVPYLYREALLKWHQFSFSRAEDELSHEYYRAGGRYGRFLDEALRIVRDIQDIVDEQGDAEARALALVFEADFIKLVNPIAPSNVKYRRARELLLEAGLPENDVQAFFRQATVIPMARYHLTLADAISEQEPELLTVNMDTEETSGPRDMHIVDFVAWNESLPFARRPQPSRLVERIGVPMRSTSLEGCVSLAPPPKTRRCLCTPAMPSADSHFGQTPCPGGLLKRRR